MLLAWWTRKRWKFQVRYIIIWGIYRHISFYMRPNNVFLRNIILEIRHGDHRPDLVVLTMTKLYASVFEKKNKWEWSFKASKYNTSETICRQNLTKGYFGESCFPTIFRKRAKFCRACITITMKYLSHFQLSRGNATIPRVSGERKRKIAVIDVLLMFSTGIFRLRSPLQRNRGKAIARFMNSWDTEMYNGMAIPDNRKS